MIAFYWTTNNVGFGQIFTCMLITFHFTGGLQNWQLFSILLSVNYEVSARRKSLIFINVNFFNYAFLMSPLCICQQNNLELLVKSIYSRRLDRWNKSGRHNDSILLFNLYIFPALSYARTIFCYFCYLQLDSSTTVRFYRL